MGEECEVVDKIRIENKLNGSMSTPATSICKDQSVAKHPSHLHDKHVAICRQYHKQYRLYVQITLHRLLDKENGRENQECIRYW